MCPRFPSVDSPPATSIYSAIRRRRQSRFPDCRWFVGPVRFFLGKPWLSGSDRFFAISIGSFALEPPEEFPSFQSSPTLYGELENLYARPLPSFVSIPTKRRRRSWPINPRDGSYRPACHANCCPKRNITKEQRKVAGQASLFRSCEQAHNCKKASVCRAPPASATRENLVH